MTDQVLTDEEIFTIICGLTRTNWDTKAIARAVEAAVLAKVPSHDAEYATRHNAYLDAVRRDRDSRVTEREVRKREVLAKREGWDACIRELNAYCTSGPDQKWWNRADFQRGRDERYPLPTCDKCGQELP